MAWFYARNAQHIVVLFARDLRLVPAMVCGLASGRGGGPACRPGRLSGDDSGRICGAVQTDIFGPLIWRIHPFPRGTKEIWFGPTVLGFPWLYAFFSAF